jgi:hypothetical protein
MNIRRRVIGVVVLLAFAALAATSAQPAVLAAPSHPYDPGPITGTSIKVEGYWSRRPDSRIDDRPQTDSRGPFQVMAWIEPGSGVASVELIHELHGVYPYSVVQMTIVGSQVYGTISRCHIPRRSEGTRLHFYLKAYNANGDCLEIDEIKGGIHKDDPYSIRIVNPAPFEGVWRRQESEPQGPRLNIRKLPDTSSTAGDLFLYHVQYMGNRANIPVLPERGELVESALIETPTRFYEYDSDDGRLYVCGDTGCDAYVKVGGKP